MKTRARLRSARSPARSTRPIGPTGEPSSKRTGSPISMALWNEMKSAHGPPLPPGLLVPLPGHRALSWRHIGRVSPRTDPGWRPGSQIGAIVVCLLTSTTAFSPLPRRPPTATTLATITAIQAAEMTAVLLRLCAASLREVDPTDCLLSGPGFPGRIPRNVSLSPWRTTAIVFLDWIESR